MSTLRLTYTMYTTFIGVRLWSRSGPLSFTRSRIDPVPLIEPVDLRKLLRRDDVARACPHGPQVQLAGAGAASTGRHQVADQLAVGPAVACSSTRYYWLLLAEGRLTRQVVRRYAAENCDAAAAGRIGVVGGDLHVGRARHGEWGCVEASRPRMRRSKVSARSE